jgi:hypothetical protein
MYTVYKGVALKREKLCTEIPSQVHQKIPFYYAKNILHYSYTCLRCAGK